MAGLRSFGGLDQRFEDIKGRQARSRSFQDANCFRIELLCGLEPFKYLRSSNEFEERPFPS